uniref:MADF domain-containing protein n=1 Tax=Timema cristinae TaxID=61476 RepID=A0A7R9DBQ5_TIMCR|nr:unnamed protein product [Timema cristinae]
MSDWSKLSIETLIDSYKEHQNLYNTNNKKYHNRNARRESLKKVLAQVRRERPNTTVDECIKKFQSLRSYYGQQQKKIRNSFKSGDDSNDIYQASVWWFQKMDFLEDFIQTRKSKNHLSCDLLATQQENEALDNETDNGDECIQFLSVGLGYETEPHSDYIKPEGETPDKLEFISVETSATSASKPNTGDTRKRKPIDRTAPIFGKMADIDTIALQLKNNEKKPEFSHEILLYHARPSLREADVQLAIWARGALLIVSEREADVVQLALWARGALPTVSKRG